MELIFLKAAFAIQVLVLITVLNANCNSIEDKHFSVQQENTESNQTGKSSEDNAELQVSAYFPSPNEDGSFFLVNLEEPPKTEINFSDDSVKFYLYTTDENGLETMNEIRTNETDPEWLKYFKRNASLIILCHGYKGSPDKPFPAHLRKFPLLPSLLPPLTESLNVNVVVMGWDALSNSNFYLGAVDAVRYVGEKASEVVDYVYSFSPFQTRNVHFIGHNLGAHVGGVMGQLLQKKIGRIGRITAIDPAALKDCSSDLDRLDPSDADFVDAVHTDSGDHCGTEWLKSKKLNQRGSLERNWGYGGPVGHFDFYPDQEKIKSTKSGDTDICGPCNLYRLLMQESQMKRRQGRETPTGC